jgi:flagellar protein FlgJ
MDLSLPLNAYVEPPTSQIESSLGMLRAAGARQSAEKIREAAHEFEGFFVSYLLKTMRETVHAGLLKNQAGEMFQSFYDQELGRLAAEAGGFGIGTMVETYIRQQNLVTDSSGLKFSAGPADTSTGEGGTLDIQDRPRVN